MTKPVTCIYIGAPGHGLTYGLTGDYYRNRDGIAVFRPHDRPQEYPVAPHQLYFSPAQRRVN